MSKDPSGLSARQVKILTAIQEGIQNNGYPPSVREIGEAAGLSSSASVQYQLKALEEAGFIRRDGSLGRAIEVVEGDSNVIADRSRQIPLVIVSRLVGKRPVVAPVRQGDDAGRTTPFERNMMFFMGLGILVLVPVFKTVTHLPPFMGILFGLGLLWFVGEMIHREKPDDTKVHLTLVSALGRIDLSSIMFFVGILLSVATLEHTHVLSSLAAWLDQAVGRQDVIVLLIGLASAVVDNVPLVAASMGMYDLAQYPADSFLWEFMAYCAGTGGSILIIGSAAGVAAMGLEKIDFVWYAKKFGWLALAGYAAGAAVYILEHQLFF